MSSLHEIRAIRRVWRSTCGVLHPRADKRQCSRRVDHAAVISTQYHQYVIVALKSKELHRENHKVDLAFLSVYAQTHRGQVLR